MSYLGRSPTGSILTGADIADGSISTAKLADTAVSTAKIADDAVGNTKLNLASDYAFTGTITGASDVVLISTQTTGSTPAINFTSLDNTYNHYQIFFQDLQFASNNQTFILRISDDNGSSFKSSGYLSILHQGYYNGSTVDKSVNASVNHHLISTDVTNASDNRSTFGYVYFRTPATVLPL